MKLKKIIYIILAMILGLILSFLVHAVIEIFYINDVLSKELLLESGPLARQCYLPLFLQILLPFFGLIGGYFLGQKGWQIVYLEKRQGIFRNKTKKAE